VLPADNHVHSEWSWDALGGSMMHSCVAAESLGLPSIAFTEHADFTRWTIAPEGVAAMPAKFRAMIGDDVSRPGFVGDSQPCEGRSHASTEEVPGRSA